MLPLVHHLRTPSLVRHLRTPIILTYFLGGSGVAGGDGVIGSGGSAVSSVGGVIEGDGVAGHDVVGAGGAVLCFSLAFAARIMARRVFSFSRFSLTSHIFATIILVMTLALESTRWSIIAAFFPAY